MNHYKVGELGRRLGLDKRLVSEDENLEVDGFKVFDANAGKKRKL